ncbi:MAG TPA: LysM peptidoglycan-binding domain-containing protein [Caldithrix abyssi]|uniref:LysM peptidoglycan-binding domain-containing protein n=1 Tax=Caldithrix abyssi TaxID=187145 RepID=A0A7V4U151_CALAY|nr:LysM peptidoglycan-binding domain-containing protein [Caldithrix abyssi]
MKRILTIAVLLVSILAFSNVFAQYSYNYEEMEQEEYNALLAEWQQKLQQAESNINDENAKIDALKSELDQTQSEIDATWEEIFQATGTTRADYDKYVSDLSAMKNQAQGILSMSPEEIYRRSDELDQLQAQLDEMKQNPFGVMSDNAAQITAIQNLITNAKEKGKPAVPPTYTVMRGDYLWKIASKEDIYNDAYAWMRIYTANRDQIKNPDLIYPNQVFNIPREAGPNEYWVQKGEFLSKIASSVYGSPFKWQQLYDANKDVIADPNMIYPYQVLKVVR